MRHRNRRIRSRRRSGRDGLRRRNRPRGARRAACRGQGRRRPAVVATDVARLIEARKVLASTEEGKETQSAEGWIRLFRHAGLSSVETVEETHWATFRGPDAYLDYSFAWGDNEREWRHMTAESRESFRTEFHRRVTPLIADEGLVVDWNLRYFLVRE